MEDLDDEGAEDDDALSLDDEESDDEASELGSDAVVGEVVNDDDAAAAAAEEEEEEEDEEEKAEEARAPAARLVPAPERRLPMGAKDVPPADRQVQMCMSLWGDRRPSTIYFDYPPDVNFTRGGTPPAMELLGQRKLLFRTTWERNVVKNAFALAGFKRVRDGTEIHAANKAKPGDDDGTAAQLLEGVTVALGGLLGLGGGGTAARSGSGRAVAGKSAKGSTQTNVSTHHLGGTPMSSSSSNNNNNNNNNPTSLPWCGSWTRHPAGEVYATQNRYQRVNHFPGSWALGRKDRLQRTLARARKRGGTAAAAYAFVPEGYNLPAELRALEGVAKAAKSAIWIVKPPASSCGRGIRLVSSRDVAAGALPQDKRLIAQRYLDRPFTAVNGRKFDLRLYALCTSMDPLVVYVHVDGLVRFSAHKYTTRNLRCRYVHLTNYSVNKKSRKFVENDDAADDDGDEDDGGDEDRQDHASDRSERPPRRRRPPSDATAPSDQPDGSRDKKKKKNNNNNNDNDDDDDDSGDVCKWTLKKLWRWLDENGYDGHQVRDRCHDLVVMTCIAAEAEMTPHSSRVCGPSARPSGSAPGGKRPCFEVFGFDILLDADLKPWLIEVNISPSLMGSSALDRRVKGRLMADVFHTVGFEPYSAAQVKRDKKLFAQLREAKSTAARAAIAASASSYDGLLGLAPLTANKPKQDLWRRTGKPDDIDLEHLSADDWETLCHHEDELSRALQGGFVRAWPPTPPRRRYDVDDGASASASAAVLKAARAKTEAMLPLFESLRFSDCLMCLGATTLPRKLYRRCALGVPACFVRPDDDNNNENNQDHDPHSAGGDHPRHPRGAPQWSSSLRVAADPTKTHQQKPPLRKAASARRTLSSARLGEPSSTTAASSSSLFSTTHHHRPASVDHGRVVPPQAPLPRGPRDRRPSSSSASSAARLLEKGQRAVLGLQRRSRPQMIMRARTEPVVLSTVDPGEDLMNLTDAAACLRTSERAAAASSSSSSSSSSTSSSVAAASRKPRDTAKSTAQALFTKSSGPPRDRKPAAENPASYRQAPQTPETFFSQIDYLNLFGSSSSSSETNNTTATSNNSARRASASASAGTPTANKPTRLASRRLLKPP